MSNAVCQLPNTGVPRFVEVKILSNELANVWDRACRGSTRLLESGSLESQKIFREEIGGRRHAAAHDGRA